MRFCWRSWTTHIPRAHCHDFCNIAGCAVIETGIHLNPGKTKIWNAAGVKPAGCDVLPADRGNVRPNSHGVARFRFADVPAGMKILGTPLGHPDFVRASLESKSASHQRFLDRIPLLQDVQASWLLVHCAAARANYMTRVVEPGATQEFSTRNDAALWNCLCQIMQIPTTQLDDVRETASTPMKLGGLGLRSARRISDAANWASWADCLPMIQQRHPRIAALFVAQLSGQPHTTFLRAPIHLARSSWHPRGTLWLWTLDHRPGNPKMLSQEV